MSLAIMTDELQEVSRWHSTVASKVTGRPESFRVEIGIDNSYKWSDRQKMNDRNRHNQSRYFGEGGTVTEIQVM